MLIDKDMQDFKSRIGLLCSQVCAGDKTTQVKTSGQKPEYPDLDFCKFAKRFANVCDISGIFTNLQPFAKFEKWPQLIFISLSFV